VELIALRERAFAVRSENKLVPGSIDRLVVIKSGGKAIAADVIDFKTDDLDSGDKKAFSAKVEFYRPQMEAYRTAAARLLTLDAASVTARLIFLRVGCVERL
jgi:ATP-dependent exoDNAse (exonuclease V) beta subunit